MNILALTGGVGGAKLALGLQSIVPSEQLSIIVNTADDFEHLGLHISPDLDTLMYTLSGRSNTQQGWGLEGETWAVKEALERLSAPTWFQLGDKDIATHLYRTHLLSSRHSLGEATQCLFEAHGVACTVLPMCNEKVSTFVETAEGALAFQDYFVAQQCTPVISNYYFEGIESAQLSQDIMDAILACDAIVVCPSNPFVSVLPILSVPGLKQALVARNVPIVVISPIIDGQAVKGPSAKMMQELGLPVTNGSIAEFYQDFASHIVIDSSDASDEAHLAALGLKVLVTNTMMRSLSDKTTLAQHVVDFLDVNEEKEA